MLGGVGYILPDKLAGPWLEGYVNTYIYIYIIVIRGPRVHQSLTGSFIFDKTKHRNVLLQLYVHLYCVWRYFTTLSSIRYFFNVFVLTSPPNSLTLGTR